MLTPALRVGEPDPQAPWTALCEHRPLSGTSGPSSPECTDPKRGDRRGGNPRHERGVLRAPVTQARRASRDVVAHFFESASDAVYVGAESKLTANGRRSSAGQHRVHSCDRRKGLGGPRRPGPGVQGFPTA